MSKRFISPLTWPVYSFALVILLGSLLLWWGKSTQTGASINFMDALFISTSAVCVTGLSTLDIGTTFNFFGQCVILTLVQLGGLGITTYTSLVFLMLRHKVPFTDRMSVSQALLSTSFDLGSFLRSVVLLVFMLEMLGAALLFTFSPEAFTPFSAIFHAVSAFCNAGFSLFPKNLEPFAQNIPVNIVIMALIVLGGLGFVVLNDTRKCLLSKGQRKLSRYSRTIFATTLFLIVTGAACIWLAEFRNPSSPGGVQLLLPSLFQSVTARTAGFNTVNLASITSTSLMIIIALMFIGGAPGSCAGGVKITTFRVLSGFMASQMSGRRQVVINGRGAGEETQRRALTLFFFSAMAICLSTLLLSISEGSFAEHSKSPLPLLDLLFEAVSAFATAGLSTGITGKLNDFSKFILVVNMYMGRVGIFTLVLALQSFRRDLRYDYVEADLPIG